MSIPSSSSNRYIVVMGIMLISLLVIAAQLFRIQVYDDSYKLSADNNVLRRTIQYPARGIIYDRKGDMLVYNIAAYDLVVVPMQVRSFDTTLMAELLNLTNDQIRVALDEAKRYSHYKESPVVKQLSPETYGRLQEYLFQFPGFYAQARSLRRYPRPIAAHLLGYIGEVTPSMIADNPYYRAGDYIGISGIEKSYESVLRGRRGVKIQMVDVHNRIKGAYANGKNDTIAIAGQDLHLSLDAKLQEYGEKLMEFRQGSVVAIDPSNGEILSLISTPGYDPNLLVGRARSGNYIALDSNRRKPLFNRAIMALYPPGSTFKVVNGLIALQKGVVQNNESHECHGRYPIGRGVGCHSHPFPRTLTDAIKMSCNTYFCYVFRNILDYGRQGPIDSTFTLWSQSVKRFGFNQRLGIDLPGELAGIVPSAQFYNRYFHKGGWNSLTIISLAIGQGELSTTPLQMANLAAIIANRGHYFTPHVVRSIGQNPQPTPPQRHDVGIDSALFTPIVNGMYEAVNAELWTGGTGWRANVPGLSVCGKTGTAQNPHGEDHSVFIAFAPKDNPKIAIAVYIENAGGGGRWAAPVAGLMIEKYLTDTVKNANMEQWVLDGAKEQFVREAYAQQH